MTRVVDMHEAPGGRSVEKVDAVVVGLGVMGLMLTKRLVDFGQRVVAIDESAAIAAGPSTKNHGWLHTGIVHALSVSDQTNGQRLAKKLQYGHQFFSNYAPECIDEPFDPTYAITDDSDLAAKAKRNWTQNGVPFRELTKDKFLQEIEPGINPDAASFFFENDDTRINNRLLFMKLLTDIQNRGASVLRAASYHYEDEHTIAIQSPDGRTRVSAPLFFYATGPSLEESHKQLTGNSLGMKYNKSHLLLLPRITAKSVVSLDKGKPIIINHGEVSVVNRSYDEVSVPQPDYTVDQDEVERALDVLYRFYPKAQQHRDDVHAIACMKPYMAPNDKIGQQRHSVDSTVVNPVEGHYFVAPGKMTEAPFAADELIRFVASKLDLEPVSERPIDTFNGGHDATDLQATA